MMPAQFFPIRSWANFLREQNRDIVFSLCQYGMADVWKWGGSVQRQLLAHHRRHHGHLEQHERNRLSIRTRPHRTRSRETGTTLTCSSLARSAGAICIRRNLKPDEQYTHISLWCLLSAPLLIGCDMTKLDDFTLNLLENDEVLALDQDALGQRGDLRVQRRRLARFEKKLADGGRALWLFQSRHRAGELDLNQLAQFGLTGKQHVRDLWRQTDLPDVDAADGVLPLTIPAHGVVLYKLTGGKI